MWKCRKCRTENPEQSAYCQTCGERVEDIKGFTVALELAQSTKEMSISQMYAKAGQRLPNGDYSLLTFYGRGASIIGVVVIIGFILWTIVTIENFNVVRFTLGLITVVSISVSSFIIANLIELVVSLKREVNYSAQSHYVNARLNKELLETLKEIQGQLNPS